MFRITPLFRTTTLLLLALALSAPAFPALAQAQATAKPAPATPPATTPATPLLPPSDAAAEDNSYQHLGERFAVQLRDIDWGDGVVSILIQDAEYPLNVFAQNETQAHPPGGVLQIVTAAAALERLGPDYRFTTRFGISGTVEKKELKGSLLVRGDGDPSLMIGFDKKNRPLYPLFDQWCELLRKQGIKKVSGMVIGDDRLFDDQWQGPQWPLEQLGSPGLPSISALNFNQNCVDIFWQPSKKPGAEAASMVFPNLPQYVFFANKVQVMAEAPLGRQYSRERDSNVLAITGAVPLRTEVHDRASIEDPAKFFAEALKARLIEQGMPVSGATMAANKMSPPEIPADFKELDARVSPPLLQLLSEMMRDGLALNAEVIFKTLGLKAGGRVGSFGAGQDAMRDFIDSLHLPGASWSFADGSGKSQIDRISPAQLLAVMRAVRKRGHGRVLETLFPRAWDPGILHDRFRAMPAPEPPPQDQNVKKPEKKKWWQKRKPEPPAPEAPPVWAETGSGNGSEALAGYVSTRFGRKLAFAIMVSGSRVPPAVLREQIDALALTLTR